MKLTKKYLKEVLGIKLINREVIDFLNSYILKEIDIILSQALENTYKRAGKVVTLKDLPKYIRNIYYSYNVNER